MVDQIPVCPALMMVYAHMVEFDCGQSWERLLPIAATLLLDAASAGQCPKTYDLEIISPPCTNGVTSGWGISDSGFIAGGYTCNFGPRRAYGWFGSPPVVTVPLLPGYTEMRALAINPFMEIAGITLSPAPGRAFLYSNGESVLLPLLPNTNSSEALALSPTVPSRVVGYCINTVTGPLTAVTWEDGGAPLPLDLPRGPNSVASAINDNGQIVGWMGASPADARGYLWDDGVVIDMGLPEGCNNCRPSGINNKAEVCGRSTVTNPGKGPTVRGWIWINGNYTLFDPPPAYKRCLPTAINDRSTIVGLLDDAIDPGNPNNPDSAFIWKDGVMTSLRELLPPDPPGTQTVVYEARGINNAGQIVGSLAINQGPSLHRAFRLTLMPPVIGDVNCDRSVDVLDLLAVINQWGQPNAPADLNQDGSVNHADLIIVLDNWTF